MPLHSYFIKSPKANEIQDLILENRDKVYRKEKSWRSVFLEIQKLDPNVPTYQQFLQYIKRFEQQVRKNTERFMDTAVKASEQEIDFLAAIAKAMRLGDMAMKQTLDEVVEMEKEGKEIPMELRQKIMKWFNDAGRLAISHSFLKLKGREVKGNEKALELLAEAARYQKLRPEEIGDEIIKEEEKINGEFTKNPSLPSADPAPAGVNQGN